MSMPQFRCLSKKVRLKGLQPATETLRLHIVVGGDRKLSHVVIKRFSPARQKPLGFRKHMSRGRWRRGGRLGALVVAPISCAVRMLR